MVWQDMTLFSGPHMDAEQEREMRLAAQARAGADWALDALVARYQPPVFRYLTRLTGDSTRSHAIAERIFVRMERRLRGPHGAQHLRLWLLRACTEAGLDALRHPQRAEPARLGGAPGPSGLIPERTASRTTSRLRASMDKLAEVTGPTRRQVRQLIWSDQDEQQAEQDSPSDSQSRWRAATPPPDAGLDTLDPREALRHRLVRAVLAELPYGDAQCLALHLVADLNQTEVAEALGIRASAARKRIVQGLQMFASRYEAALASLGIPAEAAYEDPTPEPEYQPEFQPDYQRQREMSARSGRGEDRVIPPAASPRRTEVDDDTLIPSDAPIWQSPAQPPSASPMASMQPQAQAQTQAQAYAQTQAAPLRPVATMVNEPPTRLPELDEDTAEAQENVAAAASVASEAQPRIAHAIPIAEEAIVGPIVDSMAAISDTPYFYAPHAESAPLGYTVVVEKPIIIEATATVRTVPVLSLGPARTVPGSAIPDEADDIAEYDTRVIPVVTPRGTSAKARAS